MPRASDRRRKATRLEYLRAALVELDELVQSAAADASWNAAVQAKARALQVRAEIDELEQTQAARKRRTVKRTTEAYYDDLLAQVSTIRIGAIAAGSWVAAGTALRLEADLLASRAVAVDKAAASARAAMTLEEIEHEIARLRSQRGIGDGAPPEA